MGNNILELHTVHCLIDGKWSYPKCYHLDGHWYNYKTKEIISNYDIYNITD